MWNFSMVHRSQDSIQLLSAESDSSDSSSSRALKSNTAVRRPKFYRPRPAPEAASPCEVKKNVGVIFSFVFLVILALWIIMLTIAASTLYRRVFEVQELTNKLSAGSQGVPEEIQKCHSLSRQLQNNQTLIFSQIESMAQRLLNFSILINTVQGGLNEVENRLKGSPELVNVPDHLQSLTTSIASLGSGLEDMKTTTAHLQEAQEAIKQNIQGLNINVTGINASVINLNSTVTKRLGSSNYSANSQETNEKLATLILSQLGPNISRINESLSKRIDWVAEDQKKDHKTINDLQEVSANLSSQLISLRDDVLHLSTNYSALDSQMANLKDNVGKMSTEAVAGSRNPETLPRPIQSLLNNQETGGTASNSTLSIVPPPA